MYEDELLLNVVALKGEKSGTLYIKEKTGGAILTLDPVSLESKTFMVLVGMVSAYNERYHLEKELKKRKINPSPGEYQEPKL